MARTSPYEELRELIGYWVNYYQVEGIYLNKGDLYDHRISADRSFPVTLTEAGLDVSHPTSRLTMRSVAIRIMGEFVNREEGWWARSHGPSAEHFHASFGTPEDWKAATNLRIKSRDEDVARMWQAYELTEAACAATGYSFDPHYDGDGTLVSVDVWPY